MLKEPGDSCQERLGAERVSQKLTQGVSRPLSQRLLLRFWSFDLVLL